MAREVITRGTSAIKPGFMLKSKDRAWSNILSFLKSLPDKYNLVEWEQANLGVMAGCVYGVQGDGIICDKKDNSIETLLELKSGTKPTGLRALLDWARNDYKDAYPKNNLAAHVLQVNLQRHARKTERARANLLGSSVMMLLYASPAKDAAEIFTLPPW